MKSFITILGLFTFLLFPVQSIFAQHSGGILISVGAASHRMGDVKYIQEYILNSYPVEGKITSSFPPFTSFHATFFKQIYNHIRVGGGYGYSSTGGKSSYADYSGSLSTEINLSSHRLGAYLSYSILQGDRLNLFLYGRADANFTRMTVQSFLYVHGRSSSSNDRYRSISPSGTAGLELFYSFQDFSLGLDAAYLVDLRGDLKDGEQDIHMTDPNDRERILSSDWTGWQVELKALIWLNF